MEADSCDCFLSCVDVSFGVSCVFGIASYSDLLIVPFMPFISTSINSSFDLSASIYSYFGLNDEGFPGNPRGPVNRINNSGVIFQSPGSWTSLTNGLLSANDLKVNIQSKLNYYDATKGAFLHTEIEKLDASLGELGVVVYLIEDSLVGDQKMADNSHNENYIHRDIMRGCIDGRSFGRTLKPADMIDDKYYLNYSFIVPNQLDGNHNPDNMHVLIYVYDKSSFEIYQVIKQKFIE